jgi:hypothetical protein
VPFSVKTKGTVGKFLLFCLEKGLRCHFQSEIELKVEINLIFKILNKIKEVVLIFSEISNKKDF